MKPLVLCFAILALIGLLLYPMAVGHSSSSQTTLRNHNVMLRVVRVTPSWMPFASLSGWDRAVVQKESEDLKFYEAAIWEEVAAVHFYAFPNGYLQGINWNWNDEQRIAYREQFLISKYTGLPEAWTNERSTFLKSAFMDIVSYIVNQHP